MGRIRGKMIRKETVEILKKYKHEFTDNFEHNKQVLSNIIDTSKTTRNKIAGFITRLAKEKKIESFIIESH